VIAAGLVQVVGRPVRLTVAAVVGAESRQLDEQIERALQQVAAPEVAVIMVGANDVTHRVRPADAVRGLEGAVRRLRSLGCAVVVGTCPDLGTVQPIAQPLRYVARRLSRELAAAQTIAVVEAGGRTVSLGDLLGNEFRSEPHLMFSADRFHPSSTGYARAAAALLASVLAALDVPGVEEEQRPDVRLGEGVDDVAHAAARAVAAPGTEVSGGEIAGATRGPRGRWALLLRRSRPVLPAGSALGDTDGGPRAAGADPAVTSVTSGRGRASVRGA
jgi:lysophospholipase L1-like esterase